MVERADNSATVKEKPEGYVFGRPTDYRPDMCQKVIEWGKLGKSKTWMAAHLDVSRQTVDTWMDVHKDFFDAMTRALTLSQAYWEDEGQSNMGNREFQGSVWSRNMGARFPDEWRESTKSETNLSGSIVLKKHEEMLSELE